MRVVLFLEALLASRVQVAAADGDNVIAAVSRRVEDRLVLAHQRNGNLRGDAAERARVATHIDEVPGARVGETGLTKVSV